MTLAALGFARLEIRSGHLRTAKAVAAAHAGLLGADAAWYSSIARNGYAGSPRPALRFFPLFPELARALHDVTAIPVGGALVIISNACALLATMIVSFLAYRELRDRGAARRVAWLFNLAPPAFCYVMGYSETLLVALAAAMFLCLRRQRWWWAASWGILAGLARPVGFLLVVPAVVETTRGWSPASPQSRAARVAAVVAPVAGGAAYFGWVWSQFGDLFAPLRYQRYGVAKSISSDPFVNLYRDASSLLRGTHVGSGLHLPWIVLALLLCALALKKLPVAYGSYAVCMVVVALASVNFESFERYAASAFPLTIAAVTLTRSRRVEIPVLVLSACALFGYAALAFQGRYVP